MRDPSGSSVFLKNCSPWKESMLKLFLKNCSSQKRPTQEKFMKSFLSWGELEVRAEKEREKEKERDEGLQNDFNPNFASLWGTQVGNEA